ncbi:MAG: VOC family protein [Planctomycetota bacterium]
MIIPNLLVADMDRSIAFYRDLLGMEVTMSVDAERGYSEGELRPGSIFAGLQWQGAQIMLQTRDSLAAELVEVEVGAPGGIWGTVFIRGYDPEPIVDLAPVEARVRGPETTWYGMRELTLQDPDGHLVTLAIPSQPAPDGVAPR